MYNDTGDIVSFLIKYGELLLEGDIRTLGRWVLG